MAAIDALIQAFDARAAGACAESEEIVQARGAARAALLRAGLPTRHTEDWKYTSLRLLETIEFAADADSVPLTPRDLQDLGALDQAACPRLVFVDGRLRAELSRLEAVPAGVRLGAWSEAGAWRGPGGALAAASPEDAFDAVNRMFARDGFELELAAGARLADPVLVISVQTRAGASHLRHRIRLGQGAAARIVEQHVALPDVPPYLATSVARVDLGQGSTLAHVRLQDEAASAAHVSQLRATQGEGSRLDAQVLVLGARLSRQEVRVEHAAAGCITDLRAASLLRDEQHGDVHLHIAHRHPRGTSRTHSRGVFDDAAHGVFTGRVDVHAGASKTDAGMIDRNLLLSSRAEVDSRPQLQIDAEDVLCSHGAAVGQLDDAALFYLTARGIAAAEARAMLLQAFIAQVLPDIGWEPLRAHVRGQLRARWKLSMPEDLS